jgi:pyruvate,orthophosphate dikinase
MQVQAIIEAAAYCLHWRQPVRPAILLPMVMDDRELAWLVAQVRAAAESVMRRLDVRVQYDVGTMIEVPRAALLAGRLAPMVDFFSFGTNDLTQMACGISRDDSSSFLADYLRSGIFPADPFTRLDIDGVGQLVQMATRQGRVANPRLQCGVCGEQAGDPATIAFCETLGMDYVSCSPYRIPSARLAAARARL